MIAHKYRLPRWKVKKILNQPESNKIGYFIVKKQPNNFNYHRWALTISKKFTKKAVDRVRKRRQIYEAIRNVQKDTAENEEKKYYDIALIPHKQILSCNYNKILQNITDIFSYLNN